MPTTAICHAEGSGSQWEAICLNFDLAVQGISFHDVYDRLNDQIALFLEEVAALPEIERKRLLSRRAPIAVWFQALVKTLRLTLGTGGVKASHEYSIPLNGGFLPA